MKKGTSSLSQLQQEYKVRGLCVMCGKPADAFYANFGNAGACSRACTIQYEQTTSLPNADLREFKKGV